MDRQMEGRIEGWMVDERMDRRKTDACMNGWQNDEWMDRWS